MQVLHKAWVCIGCRRQVIGEQGSINFSHFCSTGFILETIDHDQADEQSYQRYRRNQGTPPGAAFIVSAAQRGCVALALHCPLGPIALAANLQLDAVCYNAFIQEQSLGIHYNQGAELMDYVLNPEDFAFHSGYMLPPKKPGLGVEVNEALVIERSRNAPDWRNPVWRHADGAVAEW